MCYVFRAQTDRHRQTLLSAPVRVMGTTEMLIFIYLIEGVRFDLFRRFAMIKVSSLLLG